MLGLRFCVRASPVDASGGHSSSRCAGLSLSWPLLLRSTSSRHAGSVVVAHGPSCSAARGIFPDQGSNPCPLRRQADSQPLRHQRSPQQYFLKGHDRLVPKIIDYFVCMYKTRIDDIENLRKPLHIYLVFVFS